LAEQERAAAEGTARREQVEAVRRFSDDVAALRSQFLQLNSMTDRQARGREFQQTK
jgi:hypothetical protein